MNRDDLLKAALGTTDFEVGALSGGCVSEVVWVRARDQPAFVAKFDRRSTLEEEAYGLEALSATGTVRVPKVLGVHGDENAGVLLLEQLEVGGDSDWSRFGCTLAALHEADAGECYGFDRDNHLGPTPQPNGWFDDWRAFNRERRHGPLVAALTERGALVGSAHSLVMKAIDAFERVLPERPKPSLLHGDLWSGNAITLVDCTVAVIDPAPSVGDGLADIAMMQLFGGFPSTCFRAYAQARDMELAEPRLAAYRLYHMLNHLLIFGSGYLGGVQREAAILLGD